VRKPKLSRKLLLSLAALGTAGALAGMGTFAQYTSTASAPESITTGTVAIALGATGPANRLSVTATKVVPGDTIARAVDLISTSGDPLSTVTVTTTASPSSALDTDATNGLQLVIQACAAGWVEAGSSPAYTYTCGAGAISVLTTRAVIGANLALTNLTATTTASTTDHLLITLTLPTATTAAQVPNAATSTVTYAFTGTQRTATNR
jgi:predicted ribosomally synthesized peptide with SipW-like signal peptide